MKGLGGIKAKGKLTYIPGCKCCTFYNNKKFYAVNEAIDLKKFQTELSIGYNDPAEYPPLVKLFGASLKICLDHAVGEDVLFLNGKFNGYASDWMAAIDFAEKSNIKYNSPQELMDIYYDTLC